MSRLMADYLIAKTGHFMAGVETEWVKMSGCEDSKVDLV